jgi:hypothetical protein
VHRARCNGVDLDTCAREFNREASGDGFEGGVGAASGRTDLAPTELMLTTEPPPRAIMPGMRAVASRYGARTLVAYIIRRRRASG